VRLLAALDKNFRCEQGWLTARTMELVIPEKLKSTPGKRLGMPSV